jgi:hypothetical protein
MATGAASIGIIPIIGARAASPAASFLIDISFADQLLLVWLGGDFAAGNVQRLDVELAPAAAGGEVAATAAIIALLMGSLLGS